MCIYLNLMILIKIIRGFISALLLFFILYEPESAIVTYSFPGELSSSTCDARNFIGYVDENDFAEYIKKVELTRYSMYCLKKTGAGQWSIYAN
ncbi:hypothetical protein [Salmonella enterica]|uniref:hypothetical protein n=1 Tax=Salmonella enterica TaxID=28901 RepID=UPI001F26917D|nr:hypothetical protein [Salmonella enterica]